MGIQSLRLKIINCWYLHQAKSSPTPRVTPAHAQLPLLLRGPARSRMDSGIAATTYPAQTVAQTSQRPRFISSLQIIVPANHQWQS